MCERVCQRVCERECVMRGRVGYREGGFVVAWDMG